MQAIKKQSNPRSVAVVGAEGVVDRAGLEACDYVLSTMTGLHAVVDLTKAEHVDYRSVGILQARGRKLKAKGGELAIAAALREVRDQLRVGAGSELQLFPSVDEAVAYLQGAGPVVAVAGAARRAVKSKG